jgi:hypothetical protein
MRRQERLEWANETKNDVCDAIKTAAQSYVDGNEPGVAGDPDWVPPLFEYRVGESLVTFIDTVA